MKNSFDFIRLLAAALVLWSHQYGLLGLPQPNLFGIQTAGFFGVMIFFILSGWLIGQSFIRDPSPVAFLMKRSLRIFPAIFVLSFLSVFCLGPSFTELPLSEYFGSTLTWLYLLNAVLWVHYPLPGVFLHAPESGIVNGSLWSLPVEFALYVSVLLSGVIGIFKRVGFPAALLVGISCLFFFTAKQDKMVIRVGTECLLIFWWGLVLGLEREAAKPGAKAAYQSVLLLSLLLVSFAQAYFYFSFLILVAAAIVVSASKINWGRFLTEKTGDVSYGFYIYAYPVQRVVTLQLGSNHSIGLYCALSFIFTYALAYASWHLIEKPALSLKNRISSKRMQHEPS